MDWSIGSPRLNESRDDGRITAIQTQPVIASAARQTNHKGVSPCTKN